MTLRLTIAIPTYNRSRFLERMLTQIEGEVKGIEDSVEVMVSDNASSDDTQAMLQKMKARGILQLRVHRNATNLGAVRNIMQVMGMGRGEYTWMTGDDDLFVPGAIRQMVDELREKGPIDAAIINFNYTNGPALRLPWNGLRVYEGRQFDDQFYAATGKIQCGSAVLLRSEHAARIIEKQTRPDGTRVLKKTAQGELDLFSIHPHIYIFLESIRIGKRFGVFAEPGMQVMGDAGFQKFAQQQFFLEKGLQLTADWEAHYADIIPPGRIAFYGSRPTEALRFFLLMRPGLTREERAVLKGLAGRYAVIYRRIGMRGWRLFCALEWAYRTIPFFPSAAYGVYALVYRIMGKKTFAQLDKDKEAKGAKPVMDSMEW